MLDNFGGDTELLKDLARLFIADWPRHRAELLAALGKADAGALRAHAHSIKGSVSNFCAQHAMMRARELEFACKAGDLSQAGAQVAGVLAAVEEMIAALRAEGG